MREERKKMRYFPFSQTDDFRENREKTRFFPFPSKVLRERKITERHFFSLKNFPREKYRENNDT